MKKNSNNKDEKALGMASTPGNAADSPKEDIYRKGKKEEFTDEDFPGEDLKQPEPSPDEDLDIPGSELDDENEIVGEEDEENNYYSLGGDNHENLEEDQSV